MKLNYDTPITPCHLAALIEDLSAGCDPDFDTDLEELERQFAELRISFSN
jgi:hypothetical protein